MAEEKLVAEERESITRGEPPYYAYFEHPDGSWYMLWMTETEPKTRRGHPWHVHATFDKLGATRPALENPWFEAAYGAHNWDFDEEAEAVEYFLEERYLPRLRHGYKLITGHIHPDWPIE